PSFHAIVLAGSAAAEGSDDIDARAAEIFLRAAEPPEHNDWKATSKVTNVYARGAKTNLRKFFENVQSEIRSLLSLTDRRPDDGPEALKELLQIVMPPPSGERSPRVSKVRGFVESDGAWTVSVEVTCPQGPETQSWSFTPELRFAVQSGAGIKVPWSALQPLQNCESDGDGRLRTVAGGTSVEFTGSSAVNDHPAESTDVVVKVSLAKMTRLATSKRGGE
ncbi:MAG: transcriptional regulator, partial [Microthrixaceae bacterium]